MPDPIAQLIAGHERHILAQMIADDDIQEVGLDGSIGPYRLAECLGEGGFGYVWRAEQTEPVRREVALKVLKRGMDSAQVLARFSLEQQALASMEHPHIAALLDAGATRDGRPFFVMELVRGPSITAYCREKKLPWQQRVALFKDVCGGVQHAHQKGMIHRDLKPTNILVAEVDGQPVPKIIDFGIAKAMTEGIAAEPFFTRAGHVMGTPLYMSPEQLRGGRDVDTRSDVYALGVLFYEMLTGSLPYQALVRSTTGPAEMLRIVTEQRPLRPSVKVTQTVQMAALRGEIKQQAEAHVTGIPADLDWIILKALEQDRERRYDSVSALIADVQRFQNDEPVQAHPPSFSYLSGRWVRRNRIAFAAACVSLTAILFGAGVALWQAHEARLAQRSAEVESARALQAVGFLTAMLDRVAVEIANGRNPEALRLALENSQELIQKLNHDPVLQAELFKRVGWLYETMGDRKLALPLLKSHVEELSRLDGENSPTAWEAELAYLTKVIDHGARNTAPPLLKTLLQRMKQHGALRTDIWFKTRRQLVRAWTKLREPQKACEVAETTLEVVDQSGLPATTIVGVKAACLDAYKEAKDYAKAESLAEQCLTLCAQDEAASSQRDLVEDRYVWIMRARNDHSRGARFVMDKITRLKKSAGAQHPSLIKQLLELARFEFDARAQPEAIQHLREALTIAHLHSPAEGTVATTDTQTLREDLVHILCRLADYESQSGQHPEAIRDAQEAVSISDAQGHLNSIADALLSLASAQERAGDLDAAYATHQLRGERTGQHGANYQRWHEDLQSMCLIRLKQNRADEAMSLAQELWKKETASEEARQDKAHIADIARLALRCHTEWKKNLPDAPEPVEFPAWKEALKR